MNSASFNQKGGASSLPARWFCDSATPFKGCQCSGSNCQQCHGQLYSCGHQAGGSYSSRYPRENFTVQIPTTPKQILDRVQKAGQALLGGQSEETETTQKNTAKDTKQEGGAIRFPARYFHPEAASFKGPQCAGSQVSSTIYACGGAGLQEGAGYGSSAIPKIQYGNNEPINPQALTLSQKAYQQGNSSFDYYNVYSQWPCHCFDKQYKYYGDFNQHNCQSRQAQVAGLAWRWPRDRPHRPEDAQLAGQQGGSGAVGTPFSIWNRGVPLTQSYPHTEGPLFVPVGGSNLAGCGCAGQL